MKIAYLKKNYIASLLRNQSAEEGSSLLGFILGLHFKVSPIDLMRVADFSRSAVRKLTNSAGDEPRRSTPALTNRSMTAGFFKPALSAAFSLATMAAGVAAGAERPPQVLMIHPPIPASAEVGTSDAKSDRAGAETASADK